eukprot:scaffold5341_cov72-Cyclotella_meneghiniana.AAC.4
MKLFEKFMPERLDIIYCATFSKSLESRTKKSLELAITSPETLRPTGEPKDDTIRSMVGGVKLIGNGAKNVRAFQLKTIILDQKSH